MSQLAKPISDAFVGAAWTKQSTGLDVNLYLALNEGTGSPDNGDYAIFASGSPGDYTPLVFKLTSIDTPANGNVTLTIVSDQTGTMDNLWEIRQGYVNESAKGTLLGSAHDTTGTQSAFGLTTKTVAITGATDGADLYFRCVATNVNSGLYAISAVQGLFPDGAPAVATGIGAFALKSLLSIAMVGTATWATRTGTLTLQLMPLLRMGGVGAVAGSAATRLAQLVRGRDPQDVMRAGFVLKLDGDGQGNPLVAILIDVTNSGQQFRWAREAILVDAFQVPA